MYADPDAVQVLLENAPNVPTFLPGAGLKTEQNWQRSAGNTNAGLFFFPSGTANAYFDPPYDHDRDAMLAAASAGVPGYGSAQSLVLHVESSDKYDPPDKYDELPEYVYAGVRSWAGTVPVETGREVLLVVSRAKYAGVALGAAASLRDTMPGVSIVPVGMAEELLSGALKNTLYWSITGPKARQVLAALEAGCLYSLETGEKYGGTALAGLLTTLTGDEVGEVLEAAHAVVEVGRAVNFDPVAWAAVLDIELPTSGGASWFGDIKTRTLRYESWGSSTENGIRGAYSRVIPRGGMKSVNLGNSNKGNNKDAKPSWKGTVENPSDIMLKRSHGSSPGPTDYFPDTDEVQRYHIWMKFDYQYDKVNSGAGDWNVQCMDSWGIGSPWNAKSKVLPMLNNNQKANFFPMRWFIAEEVTQVPGQVMRDSTHLSQAYEEGVASGMLTLATGGRSFVGNEPDGGPESKVWRSWHARRTGYVLAWQFATLRPSAPFLEVWPESTEDASCRPRGTQPGVGAPSATVRFGEAPRDMVRVEISVDSAELARAVLIYPTTIDFYPANYTEAMGVYVITSGEAPAGTEVPVVFRTQSDDPRMDDVEDTWVFITTDQGPTNEPTTLAPTYSLLPSVHPSVIPSVNPSVNPSVIQPKTCSVLSKNKCKKRKEDCLFSKKRKNKKPCSVKKNKYNHECKQYEDKKACRAVQYCSYSKETCSHKCDTTKRKCKKEREGIDGPKICNYEKYQPCANNCCGCCKL